MKKCSAILTIALILWGTSASRGGENTSAACPEKARPASIGIYGIDAIEGFYARALDSPVEGVVHSALANVASIALLMPEEKLTLLKEKVTSLIATARTPETRYRASLT